MTDIGTKASDHYNWRENSLCGSEDTFLSIDRASCSQHIFYTWRGLAHGQHVGAVWQLPKPVRTKLAAACLFAWSCFLQKHFPERSKPVKHLQKVCFRQKSLATRKYKCIFSETMTGPELAKLIGSGKGLDWNEQKKNSTKLNAESKNEIQTSGIPSK